MTRKTLLALIFFVKISSTSALGLDTVKTENLRFTIQTWQRECRTENADKALSCEIAQRWQEDFEVAIALTLSTKPREAHSSKVSFEHNEIKGELRIFSVYPHPESQLPPYLHVQLEIISPERTLCMQSVRTRNPIQIPSLICTALSEKNAQWFQKGFNLVQIHANSTPESANK